MVVRHTGFDPRKHGFSFPNLWHLGADATASPANEITAYLLARGTLGFLGPTILPHVMRIARPRLERALAPRYGLCGGMVFAALDFYNAGVSVPRQIKDTPSADTPLYRFLWRRQLDSMLANGRRFVLWTAYLKFPDLGQPHLSGEARLLRGSQKEWRQLKDALDNGKPVPIGLIRDGAQIFANHQVLAVGYEQTDERHIKLFVYDPNHPDTETVLNFAFGERALVGFESIATGEPATRAFFCEAYTPAEPPSDLGEASA